MRYSSIKQWSAAKKDAFCRILWHGWTVPGLCWRILLNYVNQLRKKILVYSSIFFYFLTSSQFDRPKIDPIALPFPVRYPILLSSLLSPAKALLSRHCCLPHPVADFILKPPLSKLSQHLSLHHRVAGSDFLLALTLPSSSRCFRHCAATRFIVAPPLPSSLRRQFCLCRCAATAFFVTPPFPSLSRRQFCLRHRSAAAFVIAPPPQYLRTWPHKSQKWIYKIKTLLIEQFIVSNLTFNVSQIHQIDLGVTLNVIYIVP